ncbi:hypothetical protein [Mucilaginibacter sp. KACC 22063]|nr:hypothetical protein [Mucilaginibacter sp. KACC 22063]WDF57102.1 hypothetical protein PQ461_08555 [Mucilaginibacter sp. KACC 22063]
MKTEKKKPETYKKVKSDIKTDSPISEKDEIKRAEDNMREAAKKLKKL